MKSVSFHTVVCLMWFAACQVVCGYDVSVVDPAGYGPYEEDYRLNLREPEDWYLFEPREFFVDFFYAVADARNEDAISGAGVGAGYYFSRCFGWMAEGIALSGEENDASLFTGGLFRLPVDHAAFSLYGLAGVGYQTGSVEDWNLQVGGGVDVRMLDRASMFFDARYVEPSTGDPGSLFRIGMRFLF